MNNKYLYPSIVIAGIICAGLLFWLQHYTYQYPEVLARENNTSARGYVFPCPEKTSYEMKLHFDPLQRTIHGSSLIRTANTANTNLEAIYLSAYPNAFNNVQDTPAPIDAYYQGFNPGSLEFLEIIVNNKSAKWSIEGVTCKVDLLESIAIGEEVIINLIWEVNIPRVQYRFGSQAGVFMLGNFHPILNVRDDNEWVTSYNTTFGDPFCLASADYLVSLSVPQEYTPVSSGQVLKTVSQDNGRQIFILQSNKVREFGLAIIANYDRLESKNQQSSIQVFYPGSKKTAALQVLQKSQQMLQYFSCQFGSYIYPEFKIVFVPMHGFDGMEYSGMIFIKEDFLNNPTKIDFLLAHEIAHQWWYAMVGSNQLLEPWLDEGLANWSAYKYQQEILKIAAPDLMKFKEGINLNSSIEDIKTQQDYYNIAYRGGEAFWFCLEEELGIDVVIKILRRYVGEYRFRIARGSDLQDIIREEAQQDMQVFFDKWFKH